MLVAQVMAERQTTVGRCVIFFAGCNELEITDICSMRVFAAACQNIQRPRGMAFDRKSYVALLFDREEATFRGLNAGKSDKGDDRHADGRTVRPAADR